MLNNVNLITLGKKSIAENFFLLYGNIDDDIAQSVSEWILSANYSEEPPEALNLFIKSEGGDLHAAWAVIDMIRGSDIPVRTIGTGLIASAGLLVFSSGKKGMRILTENCTVMSHQYSWGNVGKHHELMAVVKEYNLTHERLIKHLKKITGLKEDDIKTKLMPPQDMYYTADEAMALGLADYVKSLK
jgi:ATP-dependent Clp protease protease subunit